MRRNAREPPAIRRSKVGSLTRRQANSIERTSRTRYRSIWMACKRRNLAMGLQRNQKLTHHKDLTPSDVGLPSSCSLLPCSIPCRIPEYPEEGEESEEGSPLPNAWDPVERNRERYCVLDKRVWNCKGCYEGISSKLCADQLNLLTQHTYHNPRQMSPPPSSSSNPPHDSKAPPIPPLLSPPFVPLLFPLLNLLARIQSPPQRLRLCSIISLFDHLLHRRSARSAEEGISRVEGPLVLG